MEEINPVDPERFISVKINYQIVEQERYTVLAKGLEQVLSIWLKDTGVPTPKIIAYKYNSIDSNENSLIIALEKI